MFGLIIDDVIKGVGVRVIVVMTFDDNRGGRGSKMAKKLMT